MKGACQRAFTRPDKYFFTNLPEHGFLLLSPLLRTLPLRQTTSSWYFYARKKASEVGKDGQKRQKGRDLGSPELPRKGETCPFQFATQHLYCVIAVCFSVFLPSWCELAKLPSADTAWMM
jgi:hypothetical protein